MAPTRFGRREAKVAARELLRGMVTAFPLPVDGAGAINEVGLRADIRYCVDVLGASGLYINGNFQHFWLLTSDQRRRMIQIAVDEVAGEVPLINRVAHASPAEAIELALHAQELGVEFLDLVPPDVQFAGTDTDVIVRYIDIIASRTDLGIVVFHTPRLGYTMSPELLAEIAEIPNVCALKNGMPLEHTNKLRALVGDQLLVVDPIEERCLVNMLEYGQRVIFTGDNPMFDTADRQPMRGYVEAALAGRADEARQLFDGMAALRAVHHRWVQQPWRATQLIPISVIKYWTSHLGMSGGPTPAPLPSLTEQQQAELHADLAEVGLVSS